MRHLKDCKISKEEELELRKSSPRTKRETALLLASIREDTQKVRAVIKGLKI